MRLSGFREKYKNLSVQVKATLWFTVCNFMQRGISMLTTPIFTRVLPTKEYGIYSTYISWENILLMIVSLCLYKSMLNLYIKYDNRETVLSAVSGLTLILTGSWFLFALIVKDVIADILSLSSTLVVCMFMYFVFYAVIQCWSLHKRYVYDYRILVTVTVMLTVGSSGLGCFLVVFIEASAEMRAIANSFVTLIIGVCIYVSIYRTNRTFVHKQIWKFSLAFCCALMPHYLSEFVLQSSDKIMINYMCGASDVAIYSVAYSAGSLINLVVNAINQSFVPYRYQKIKSGQFDLLAKRANQVIAFVGIMLCFFMLFSREIVLIFGGKKYMESTYVIIPICLGVFFNYLFQLFAGVQEYYERKTTVVIPSILCAVLNLILNYIFINIYGYMAAAYTTFFCYFLFCIMHYFFYRKVCKEILGEYQIYDIRGLCMISIGVIIAGVIISIINSMSLVKFIFVFIMLVIVIFKHRTIVSFIRGLF